MLCYFFVNHFKLNFPSFGLKMNLLFLKKIKKMNLSQSDWKKQLGEDENAVILDVRTHEECAEGSIPNAIFNDIYKGQGFIYNLEALNKNKNYYVYCKAGARSSQACAIMKQMGFENTYNLDGGFMNWKGEVAMPEN